MTKDWKNIFIETTKIERGEDVTLKGWPFEPVSLMPNGEGGESGPTPG